MEIATLVPFDAACAEAYGVIRSELRRAGTPVGEIDTLIAATAIAHGATIVTHNPRHFTLISAYESRIGWSRRLDTSSQGVA